MNKEIILSQLKEIHNKQLDRALTSASKMFDWLEERKTSEEGVYIIEGHRSLATLIEYRTGSVMLVPFSSTADIGGGKGVTLSKDF